MTADHHGNGDISAEMQAALDEQKALFDRFLQERDGKANREFPNGRLSAEDDGSLTVVVSSDPDKDVVRIDFAKPTPWLAMPPQQAIALAQMLIQHARSIAKTPISIVLH